MSSKYDYKNLRLMVNVRKPENEKMLKVFDNLDRRRDRRTRNRFIIAAINQYIAEWEAVSDKGDAADAFISSDREKIGKADVKLTDKMRENMQGMEVRLYKLEKQVKQLLDKCDTDKPLPFSKEPAVPKKGQEVLQEQKLLKESELAASSEDEEYDVPEFALDFIDSLQ